MNWPEAAQLGTCGGAIFALHSPWQSLMTAHLPVPADEVRHCCRGCQRRAGFDIRYLTGDMVGPELLNQLYDFVIFDNELTYETIPTLTSGEDRPAISRTEIVVDHGLVSRRVSRFSRLWDAAVLYPEPDGNGHEGTGGRSR